MLKFIKRHKDNAFYQTAQKNFYPQKKLLPNIQRTSGKSYLGMKNQQLIIKLRLNLAKRSRRRQSLFALASGNARLKRIHAQIQALQGRNPKRYLMSPFQGSE